MQDSVRVDGTPIEIRSDLAEGQGFGGLDPSGPVESPVTLGFDGVAEVGEPRQAKRITRWSRGPSAQRREGS